MGFTYWTRILPSNIGNKTNVGTNLPVKTLSATGRNSWATVVGLITSKTHIRLADIFLFLGVPVFSLRFDLVSRVVIHGQVQDCIVSVSLERTRH